jgi:hypothetical protein
VWHHGIKTRPDHLFGMGSGSLKGRPTGGGRGRRAEGRGVFYDDLGAVGLVALRAPVCPQGSGRGAGGEEMVKWQIGKWQEGRRGGDVRRAGRPPHRACSTGPLHLFQGICSLLQGGGTGSRFGQPERPPHCGDFRTMRVFSGACPGIFLYTARAWGVCGRGSRCCLTTFERSLEMIRKSMMAAVAAAAGCAASAAAQQFVNGDFESGSLAPWVVTPDVNGQTMLQLVELIDIDGSGPLAESLAARFQVGMMTSVTSIQKGITLSQPVELTAGVPYLISFDWATNLTPPATTNTEGGVFSLVVDGARLGWGNAGSTTLATQPRTGRVEEVFVPAATGLHDIGVRITRPFTITATTNINQWVDNFAISPVVAGACCFANGDCRVLTSDLCTTRGGVYGGDGVTCAAVNCAAPPTVVAPFGRTESSLGQTSNLVMQSTERTYQAAISASELRGVVGMEITGISWRIGSTAAGLASWPEVAANWTQFDIELSTSLNPVNELSTTFADNTGPDAVLVRSGPLMVPALSYPGGAITPAVNDFGPAIPFTSAFTYVGGDLLVTIRHSGNDTGTGRAMDAISTSGSGYNIVGQARSASSLTALTGSATFFTVLQLTVGAGTSSCYANCDGSTVEPILNVDDFTCFINEYATSQGLPHAQQVEAYANCDGSTVEPALNVDDFTCFINAYAMGCP